MQVSKPECEARLLNGLVNKLGDPDRKIASKASYMLSMLLEKHPVMKVVVVREVRRAAACVCMCVLLGMLLVGGGGSFAWA